MKSPATKTKISLQLRTLLSLTALVFTTSVSLANTERWIGVSGTSVTTNWSDNLNWNNVTGGGNPGPNGNDVIFGDGDLAGVGVVNSVVDANLLNPNSMTFTNNSANGNFYTVLIPAGIAVTNANGLTVGIRNSTANSYQTTVAIVGAGTLVQNGSSVQVDNSTTTGGSGLLPTLDLSGLTNFIFINTNSGSALNVAGFNGSEARGSGLMNLAAISNFITVSNINVALSTGNGGIGGTLNLGSGTNIINTANISLGAGKVNSATVKFFGATGGLRIRGFSGTDSDRSVNITLGSRGTSGSGTAAGTFNFLGGYPIDVKANTMLMGRSTQNGAGNGTLSFDTGTFDITTINMAVTTSNNSTANITVSGGTLIASNISMANQTFTGVATGNLNINGSGTVIVSNNIIKTTVVGVGNIAMTGGSLIVGTNIGASGNSINLSMSDSSLTLPVALAASAWVSNLTAAGTTNTINITSVPTFFSYPAQFSIISYINQLGDNNTFTNGTLPNGFVGYISNNVASLSIDLVITNGPQLAQLKSIRWSGSPTGDWTASPSVLNWLTNSTAVNYNQGDTVTFDDTLTGTTNVNLTQSLTPTALTVNNSTANYIFTGTGKISGVTGLTKTGSGTLIIDNSGVNDFAGAVTIGAGTLQVGNNDANGNLPALTTLDDEGTLIYSRSDILTLSTIITGAGSLVQNGNGKLSLAAVNTYSGNTMITKGTLALTAVGSIDSTTGIFPQGGAFDVTLADPTKVYNVVGANNGALVVGTNTAIINTLGLSNSTITLSADFNSLQSISVNSSLTTGGTTNIINVTAVRNVPDGQALPIVIPIIRYASATFSGGFNIGETNFPNAYVTNDVANSTIDLVLTATPYLVTWNGGSTVNNNWSDSNNWSGIALIPNDGMLFDGTTRLTPFNDTPANTIYSNITFSASAGAFTLTGNPVVYGGAVSNNSANVQTILLGLGFTNNVSIGGGTAGVNIGGGLTNVSGATGTRTLTLTGSGILTNLFGSTTTVGGTNGLILNDANGTWTLLDNATATPVTAPWAFELNAGTFNFGSASSAPVVNSTSAQGLPSDNQLGNNATAVFNITNGTFTTTARFNTGAGSGSGTINQYGGTMNIGSQFQGANGGPSATSAVNLYGGTMNIANGAGQFYVASRGNSSLTVTNSALLNCGILDVSRSINGNISGTVNLDGGTIIATRVGTATANAVTTVTGSTATFNFNGGTLKAHTNSTTFFQGSVVNPVVPITAIVTARGANIDSDTFTVSFLEPLLTDPNLGGAADGGLKKFGTGTLNLNGTNTYIGNTLVGAGTLNINGQSISAVTVSNGATLGGNGVISNSVTMNAGSTLSPGSSAIGTLTVATNAITLNGTTKMEVDKVQSTSDLLALVNDTPTTITYGGTLNVVTNAGTLAPGDTFKLFSANNYVGSFAAITPSNVIWNTNNLNVDGTLTVVSIAPAGPTTNATITKVTLSGTNLLVHGTNNNVPNNALHYVVLTATNLSTALSNWTPVVTNTYNTDGTFDFSSPIVPGTPQKFIDVQAVQ